MIIYIHANVPLDPIAVLTSVSWPKSISSHCMLPTEIPQTVSKVEGQVPHILPWAVGQCCCQHEGKNYSKSGVGVEIQKVKSEPSYLPCTPPLIQIGDIRKVFLHASSQAFSSLSKVQTRQTQSKLSHGFKQMHYSWTAA